MDELFSIYKVGDDIGVSLSVFQQFLASLLEQIESDVCHSDAGYINPYDVDFIEEKLPSLSGNWTPLNFKISISTMY